MPSIRDFATWEPVLGLLRAANAEGLAAPGGHVAGRIDRRGGWSLPFRRRFPPPGRALLVSDMQDEFDAVQRVQGALADGDIDSISFVAEISPSGRTVLHLLSLGPAAEPGIGNVYPGSLILVEGSVPEPWRRLPEPVPGARPARPVDLALLERTLRERLPGAIGATEAEIAAAEARLGVALPAELKVLYRVTRARREDWGDHAASAAEDLCEAVGCYLFPLDELYLAAASARPCPWWFAATQAVITPARRRGTGPGRLARLDRLRPRRRRRPARGRPDTGRARAHRADHHAPPRGLHRGGTALRFPHRPGGAQARETAAGPARARAARGGQGQ